MKAKRTKRTRRKKRAERFPRRIEGLPERLRLTIESYGTVSAAATAIKRSEGALRKWIRGTSEPNASASTADSAGAGERNRSVYGGRPRSGNGIAKRRCDASDAGRLLSTG